MTVRFRLLLGCETYIHYMSAGRLFKKEVGNVQASRTRQAIAVLVTFVVSSLFHEIMLTCGPYDWLLPIAIMHTELLASMCMKCAAQHGQCQAGSTACAHHIAVMAGVIRQLWTCRYYHVDGAWHGYWLAFFSIQGPLYLSEAWLKHALRRSGVKVPAWVGVLAVHAVLLATAHYFFFPLLIVTGVGPRFMDSLRQFFMWVPFWHLQT